MAQLSLSIIMTAAWTLARQGAAAHGGKVRSYLAQSLRQVWVASRKPRRQSLSTGRNAIRDDLSFCADVVGGGAVTPRIRVVTGYDTTVNVRYEEDYRSGSQRSGSLLFQLDEDRLYEIYAAENSSRGRTTLVSTYNNLTVEFSSREFEAEKRRLYPAGYELAQVKREQARVAEEARAAQQIIAERERLERMRIDAEKWEATLAARKAQLEAEAEKIEEEGQPVVEGLPLLTGSAKQVAWALKIRNAVRTREPWNKHLRRATTATYWIDNYRTAVRR